MNQKNNELTDPVINAAIKGGFSEIWCKYPFKEGSLFGAYAPGAAPRYGWTTRPDKETLDFVGKAMQVPVLTLENLRAFLQTQCNAQNLEDWTWTEIIWALHYHRGNNKNPENADQTGVFLNLTPAERSVLDDFTEIISSLSLNPTKKGTIKKVWLELAKKHPSEYGRRGMPYNTFQKHLRNGKNKNTPPTQSEDRISYEDMSLMSHRFSRMEDR